MLNNLRFKIVIVLLCGIITKPYAQSLNELIDQSETALEREDWASAIASIGKINDNSQFVQQLGKDQYSEVLGNLGTAYLEMGHIDEAKKHFEESLQMKKEIGDFDSDTYGKLLQQLGYVNLELGKYDAAQKYILEAIDLISREKGTDSYEYARALSELGEFYEDIGYFQEALQNFKKAHNIIESIHEPNSPEYAEICGNMGRILTKNGSLSQAEKYLVQTCSIYENLGKRYLVDYAEALESLGVLYENEGKFALSEKILLQALDLKRSISTIDETLIIETLNDLGILYQHLGNIEKSEFYFEQVYEKCLTSLGKDHGYYGIATNNLGTIAKKKGEFEKARELLSEALKNYETTYGNIHPLYADALNNLASVESSLKMYDEADQHYRQVLDIDRMIYGTEHPVFATALTNYGILLFKKGEIKKAEQMYLQALRIKEKTLGINHPSYARSLENLGLYYYVEGDLDESEKYLRQSVDIQKDQISGLFPVLTEQERERFYETIREDIERYNYVALQMIDQKPEVAEIILNNQIQTKAILLNASERAKENILESDNQELIETYKNWSRLKDRLVRYYQIGKSRLAENQIDLKEVEGQVEDLEKQLLRKSNDFDEIVPDITYTWKDIQVNLQPDETVVEIVKIRKFNTEVQENEQIFGFLENSIYLALIFSKNSDKPEVVVMEEGFNMEEIHYPYYANALEYNLNDEDSYKYFWKDIDKKIKGSSSVYVSPDGVYHKLNPNVFRKSSRSYLIDDYYVSYITNCSDLLKTKDSQEDLKRAYLVGNPDYNLQGKSIYIEDLPGAEKEVNEISKKVESLLEWDSRKYIGDAATESRLKNLYKPTVLHVATHGFFMDQDKIATNLIPQDMNPLFRSGIYMSGAEDSYRNEMKGYRNDPENDGILTAYEAMNLELQSTHLVVLSACETGLGEIANGEGVYGLQRAFMVAGARSLIISLTKVQDEATQKLMTYFYDQYIKTNQIKSSLKYAQLKLREEYDNPYLWGAFLLIGKG